MGIIDKNSMLAGLLAGSIIPIISCVIKYYCQASFYLINKPALPFFIAIAINLVFIRISVRKNVEQTGKGIMVITFVFMLFIFTLKLYPIR